MKSATRSPVIYWVVGDDTGVGKTTVAAALIRLLVSQGRRAIGFKPFAVSRLADLIDFMLEKYPGSDSKLFGADAWDLAQASPLTPPDCLELVSPVQVICHPTWDTVVLARCGAAALDNRAYVTTGLGAILRNRADVKRITARTGLPIQEAEVKDQLALGDVVRLAPEAPKLAFDRLLQIGVDAVVCEGAGPWLPVWQGCPAVNHALVLVRGVVGFVPNVDECFAFSAEQSLRDTQQLIEVCRDRHLQSYSSALMLVEQEQRADMARRIVRRLLKASADAVEEREDAVRP